MVPGSAVGDFVKHVQSMVELLDRAQQRDELAYRILDTASLATAADRAAARSLGVLKRRGWTRRDQRIWAWHRDAEGTLPRGRVSLLLRRHEDAVADLLAAAITEAGSGRKIETYGPLLRELHDAAQGFYAAARALAEERPAAQPSPERRARDSALGRVYTAIDAVRPYAQLGIFPVEPPPQVLAKSGGSGPGSAATKLTAALIAHHGYESGSCSKFDPIGVRKLAEKAGVAAGSATNYFNTRWGGYATYRRACAHPDSLHHGLAAESGEIIPRSLMGHLQFDPDDYREDGPDID